MRNLMLLLLLVAACSDDQRLSSARLDLITDHPSCQMPAEISLHLEALDTDAPRITGSQVSCSASAEQVICDLEPGDVLDYRLQLDLARELARLYVGDCEVVYTVSIFPD